MTNVVVISGGSKGLGLGMVKGFLQQGDIVATFSRSKSEPIVAIESNDHYADRFYFRALDICDESAMKGFINDVYHRYQQIDVLINNAGVAAARVITLMASDEVDRLLAINLSATIKLTQMCSKIMLTQNHGVVINISSIIANNGYAGMAVYSASKAGMEGMTRSLARELGCKGIRVNAIAPGYIETDMSSELTPDQLHQIIRRTPLLTLATSEDVFNTAQFLASNQSKSITGQIITVDGGLTC